MHHWKAETYVWDQKRFGIGVEEIDQDHQLLFSIVNKLLHIASEETKDRAWACQQSCTYFEEHALAHFKREEDYMLQIAYPHYPQHKKIHEDFRERTLPILKKELVDSKFSPEAMDRFIGVAAGWLIGHTLTEDMAIVGRCTSGLSATFEESFNDEFARVAEEIGEDMFHLGARLLTDAYGGESFGRGVYYQQIFDTGKNGEKQSVIMVFEEKLLLSSLGHLIGVASDRIETVLVHALRHTARQYIRRILENFPQMAEYQLAADNMLTYEQFEQIFSHYPMRTSLLFTSPSGYLALCLPAPHAIQKGVDVPEHQEAISVEVEEYLKQREIVESKPKILIVDDSSIVRHRMMEYLDQAYDVALAASGMAAMRAIVLNKPAIMLLSYNMKEWDAPKTLASLKEYGILDDIPVVCLIESNDKASVRKVSKLTPYGYALKKVRPKDLVDKVASVLKQIEAEKEESKGIAK